MDKKHLSVGEFITALFARPEDIPKETTKHLAECELCKNLLSREKRKNQIYLELVKARASGQTDEEFWKEIEETGNVVAEEIFNVLIDVITPPDKN